ncbi:MAG: sulfatase, partial [Planctomycetes bacterium]|nr:sulfatase [Planctomycetota bacterium]
MKQRPNVLFLMSDQHNAGSMSCAGHPNVRTPNLDRVAAAGIRFTRAYCNNPICAPSRA